MLDFLFQKRAIKNAQKLIDQLEPKVNVHVPEDLPLPSVKRIKEMCRVVAQINGLEEKTKKLTDRELRAKTDEFYQNYKKAVVAEAGALDTFQESYRTATHQQERDDLKIQIEEAQEVLSKAKQKY